MPKINPTVGLSSYPLEIPSNSNSISHLFKLPLAIRLKTHQKSLYDPHAWETGVQYLRRHLFSSQDHSRVIDRSRSCSLDVEAPFVCRFDPINLYLYFYWGRSPLWALRWLLNGRFGWGCGQHTWLWGLIFHVECWRGVYLFFFSWWGKISVLQIEMAFAIRHWLCMKLLSFFKNCLKGRF